MRHFGFGICALILAGCGGGGVTASEPAASGVLALTSGSGTVPSVTSFRPSTGRAGAGGVPNTFSLGAQQVYTIPAGQGMLSVSLNGPLGASFPVGTGATVTFHEALWAADFDSRWEAETGSIEVEGVPGNKYLIHFRGIVMKRVSGTGTFTLNGDLTLARDDLAFPAG